ncbi:MAG TPA: hypothetical protein VN851_24225 [Thermoanaerobaculia bacterium]|nr:hypothetical protein [Thermoanaerobaculia bacterium]
MRKMSFAHMICDTSGGNSREPMAVGGTSTAPPGVFVTSVVPKRAVIGN